MFWCDWKCCPNEFHFAFALRGGRDEISKPNHYVNAVLQVVTHRFQLQKALSLTLLTGCLSAKHGVAKRFDRSLREFLYNQPISKKKLKKIG